MDHSGEFIEKLKTQLHSLQNELKDAKKALKEEVKLKDKIRYELDERRKELKCHNLLSQIFSLSGLSRNQVFQEILDAIPSSWQFPEYAQAGIKIDEEIFQTVGFQSSVYKMAAPIFSGKEEVGEITVGYPILKNVEEKDVFLKEEKDLLRIIAERIGNYLQKSNIEKVAVENELMYKSFMDASPDSITITDLEGNILFTSPHGLLLFGFSKETEFLHHNIFEFIDGEYHEKAKNAIREMFEGNHRGAEEYRGVKADGSQFYIEVNGDFIRDTEGNPSKLIFVTRDISERKRIESNLIDSERQLKNMMGNLPGIAYRCLNDETWTMLFISEGCNELTGYSPEEFTGENQKPYNNIIHPEDRDYVSEVVAKAIQNKNSFELEYRIFTSSGKVKYVWEKGQAIYENDNILYLEGLIIDITSRKELSNKLEQSESKYRYLVESINDVIYEIKGDGTFVYVNPVCERIFGYKAEELIGKKLFDYLYQPDLPLIINAFKNHLNQSYNHLDYRIYNKSGEVRWVRSSTTPVFENGKLVGGTGVLSDVTEVKTAELKLMESEEKHRLLFEFSADPVLILEDGIFTEANSSAFDFFGFQIGKKLGKLSPWDISPEFQPDGQSSKEKAGIMVEEACKKGHTRFEWVHINKDGEEKWMDILLTLLPNSKTKRIYSVCRDISLSKKQEKELRESKERFEQIAEQSQTVIWEVDKNGLYTYVNPMAEKVWGYKPEELVGKIHYYDLHPEENREEFIKITRQVFAEKQTFTDFPNFIVRKDGRIITVATNGIPILNERGNLKGYRGADNEITEKLKAEEALKNSEIKYRTIFENIQDTYYEVSADGVFLEISPSIEKMSKGKYKREDLIGRKTSTFFANPEEQEVFINYLKKDGSVTDYELTVKDNNGTPFPIAITANVQFDDNGRPVKSAGVMRDITERKQAEFQLKQSEEKYRGIFENIQDAYYEATLEGIITEISPSIEFLSGGQYKREELIGKSVIEMYENPEERELIRDSLFQKGRINDFEISMLNKDGSSIPVAITSILKTDDKGRPVKITGIMRDITERKKTLEALTQSEEEIKNINRRLNAILEALPDLLFIVNEEGTYLDFMVNKDYELVIQKEQIIGSSIFDTFPPDQATYILEKQKECLDTKKMVVYDYSLQMNNQQLYYEARISPFTENSVIVFTHDITEKKLNELTITKLSLAVQQSTAITVITDLDGNIEYVNPAFEKITGYKINEVLGKNPRILQSGKTKISTYKDLWKTILNGNTWNGEWLNRKKNGELYWEDATISPIKNAKGVVINYLAVKRDITEMKKVQAEIMELTTSLEQKVKDRTRELEKSNKTLLAEIKERKIAEAALQEKTKELESFFNVTPDLLSIFDKEGIFLKANYAWEEITGYSEDDLKKLSIIDVLHPDDLRKGESNARESFRSDNSRWNVTSRIKLRSGEYRTLEWHNYVYEGLMYSAARDITQQKKELDFQEKLLNLASHLTGIPFNEIKPSIEVALGQIGQFLSADRSYIFELDEGNNTMSNTYEWCNHGITREKDNLQEIPCELFPNWMDKLYNKQNILIPDVSELPKDLEAEKDILEPQGIKSVIIIPLLSENQLIGFAGLDYVNSKKEFTTSEIQNLKLWSTMLTGLINNLRIEELLQISRQNYETFFNTIDDFLFVVDPEGKIVQVNDTVINRLNFSNEELYGNSVLMIRPEERREEAKIVLQDMLDGKANECSIPIMTRTGEQILVETKVKKGFWNGNPILFAVSKDISQIKLSEEKFSKAFHSNIALMAISTIEEIRLVEVNSIFLDVLGYSRDEVIGKTIRELKILSDGDQANNLKSQLIDNKPVKEVEIEFIAKNKQKRIGLFTADFIYIGNKKRILSSMVDITERKQMENKLIQAQLEAEKANQAKSEFLSRMSHELRTPMNSILGFAQLLEMGQLNPKQSRGVTHIIRSGKHLLSLINEVLEISRIESGRLSLSIESVSLKSLIQEIIDVEINHAKSRGIKITTAGISDDFRVEADKQKLKQILLNLVNNSIKYNRDGGKIKIQTKVISKNGTDKKYVRISVHDTGIGISSESISKLFKPFERIGADNTLVEGTGLGLAVSKKLTDAMKGDIGVESRGNNGSTFWVDFPFIVNVPGSSTDKEQDDVEEDLLISTHVGTILYIEDNESNIELVEQILTDYRPGIKLVTEKDGNKAIEDAINLNPDLILLDLNLPGMQGDEILKEMLKNDQLKGIPIIIISADAMPNQVKKLLALGAHSYLTKPLNISQFFFEIDQFFTNI